MDNKLICTFNEAEKLLMHALPRKASVMLSGSPSSGKTAIGFKVAKAAKLEPIVFSLMDHEPSDIAGLPDLSGEKATFKPFDTFPVEGDPLPEGKVGWLCMMDEFASGTRAMQAACNKILYERMVGNKKLHPQVYVMAMGNLATDNAYVNEMPSHTQSRQIHLYVQQDVHEWSDWALGKGLDSRVIAYALQKPATITRFDPDNVHSNYPCARTMEELSNQIKGVELAPWLKPLIAGTIGEGEANNFYNWCMLKDELATMEEILAHPETALVPEKASHRYFMSALLAEHLAQDNIKTLFVYIKRMGIDYQHFILSAAVKANRSLYNIPEVKEWASEVAQKYLRKAG